MSTIDLVILGIVAEKPQSAYDIQKDIEYHHLSRWTKISVHSIYRKVLQLSEKGYLRSDIVKEDRFADKAVYFITDEGKDYFNSLMQYYATQTVPLLFDFYVVIANLNKLNKNATLDLFSKLKESITVSVGTNEEYLTEYSNIPLVEKTIIEQQGLLYKTLLEWLDTFREQFERIN